MKAVPKSGEGTGLWLLKIVSGLLVLLILAAHFIVNHLVGSEGGLLTYAEVVAYYDNPLIPIMEILFILFVVSHALMGIRSIILDLRLSPTVMRIVNIVLVGVGVVSISYGIWLIIVIASSNA